MIIIMIIIVNCGYLLLFGGLTSSTTLSRVTIEQGKPREEVGSHAIHK